MSGRPRNVLVLEDESVLRASMVAGLAKLEGTKVIGVGTLAEAIASIDDEPPSVVVSDIDLPDGLGVQLIGELARRGISAAIIFVTAYRAAYGSLIPPNSGAEVIEKPVSLDTIRRTVSQRLGDDIPPSSPFTVADYVQLSCMGNHSVTISIESMEGHGRVEIVQGVLWSAVDASGATGEPAFRRLAFRAGMKIECTASVAAPGPRNIISSAESVLIEAARLLDEGARASRQLFDLSDCPLEDGWDATPISPSPKPPAMSDALGTSDPPPSTKPCPSRREARDAPPSTKPSPSRSEARDAPPSARFALSGSDPFTTLFDEAIAALLRRDYCAAARAFGRAQAMRPDDPKTKANLQRLHAMGFDPDP